MAMRQIIVDYARHSHAQKRGGDQPLGAARRRRHRGRSAGRRADRARPGARAACASLDERLPRIVECRFFTGLTAEETAEALGVSLRTVERDWKRARAWLRHELDPAGAPARRRASMDASRRARADALLIEALDLPEDEREAFVRERCGDDAELARLVLELLEDAERPDDDFLRPGELLEGPLWDRAAARLEGGGIGPGTTIGAWTIVREIGSGGMAEVYLARRSGAEFEQQAALKLIKRGIDTEEVAHRFRQERQILASLEHPNIARLLDGGVSPDGRPYFVMEYIDGRADRPLVRRAARVRSRSGSRSSSTWRARSSRRTASSSSTATSSRGTSWSTPRATRSSSTSGSPSCSTRPRPRARPRRAPSVRVMTPEYASPEQVRGEPATTASDVYQLGLLLYELLTGRRAHRLEGMSLTEIERVVCEQHAARGPARSSARRTARRDRRAEEPRARGEPRGAAPPAARRPRQHRAQGAAQGARRALSARFPR